MYTFEFDNTFVQLKIEEIISFIKNNPEVNVYKFIDGEKIKINNELVINCEFICHRINTINELKEIPTCFGVELDLRDRDNQIIMSHDPFLTGENFSEYAKHYHHGTIILNVKSERIEDKTFDIIQTKNITEYFFLDSSIPMIYLKGNKYKFATRFSEIEAIESIEKQLNLIEWIWVDCFTKYPDNILDVKKFNKKICFVSPELQGRPSDIMKYSSNLQFIPDAICCKYKNIIYWI
jgi:hypothetical protein